MLHGMQKLEANLFSMKKCFLNLSPEPAKLYDPLLKSNKSVQQKWLNIHQKMRLEKWDSGKKEFVRLSDPSPFKAKKLSVLFTKKKIIKTFFWIWVVYISAGAHSYMWLSKSYLIKIHWSCHILWQKNYCQSPFWVQNLAPFLAIYRARVTELKKFFFSWITVFKTHLSVHIK